MEKLFDKKIKRRDFIKGAAVGALGVAALGFPNILRAAEKYKFKFATFEPGSSLFHKVYWHWWCDRVEELSKGAVKFDKFPGEVLVKGPECYEAVRDGVCQTGIFTIPYEAGLVSLPTIKELPFSYVNHQVSHEMWIKMMDMGLQDYFHTYGIHIVADCLWSPYSFWTNKKWKGIKKLDDMKGCKMRVPGGMMSRAVEAMGGVPVAMPSPEAYTAMERGTIDGLSMPEASNIAFRLHEVTKYVSRPKYATTAVPVCVNLKVWNSLPKEIQGMMLQAGEEVYANLVKGMDQYQVEVVEPAIKKQGIEVVTLPDSEIARMKKACAGVWDEWLAKNGKVFNGLGEKMFDLVVKTVGKP